MPAPRQINLADLRRIAYYSRRGRRGMGDDLGTCIDVTSGLPTDCATGALMPGFTALTAAQQAAFEAGAQPGQAFSTMTAAQQAAYLAANNPPAAVPVTTPGISLSSLPTWAVPVGIGVAALVLFSSMKGGR